MPNSVVLLLQYRDDKIKWTPQLAKDLTRLRSRWLIATLIPPTLKSCGICYNSDVKFKANIEIYNGNPYVLVSPERAEALHEGWRKPMPVLVQINGQPVPAWKINMMPIGDGSFYLYLHGDVRKASDTKVGDTVMVDVEFDATYKNGPQHSMPKWFKQALTLNTEAAKNWEALTPSRKKEILRYFSWLQSDEAIQRNLEKALFVLSGNEGRFMARTWKNGK